MDNEGEKQEYREADLKKSQVTWLVIHKTFS